MIFKRKKEEEEKEKIFKNIVQKPAVTPPTNQDKAKPAGTATDEELEIPTFIRRKMGL